MENIEIDIENININRGLKIVKARDIVAKLADDREYPVVLDDENINDMIEDLISEDLIDEEGNKHQSSSISCGNTIVRIIENHFEKFRDIMKSIPPKKLQEIKEQVRNRIEKDPLLDINLEDVGIDIDNIENYIGSVEVLTIERRRVFNVYEIKKEYNIIE